MINFSTPLQGMQSAEASLNKTAGQIARTADSTTGQPQSGKDHVDLSEEMVALMKERQDFEANLKTMKVHDQMLMDTLAKMR